MTYLPLAALMEMFLVSPSFLLESLNNGITLKSAYFCLSCSNFIDVDGDQFKCKVKSAVRSDGQNGEDDSLIVARPETA